MKDLDKGKCVRPARSAHRGTALNGIAALPEEFSRTHPSLNRSPRVRELETEAVKFRDSQMRTLF